MQTENRLCRRLNALRNERSSYDPVFKDIRRQMQPRGARFSVTDNDGKRRDELIVNETPLLAVNTLSSGMMAGITSPARPWFKLSTPDPDMANFAPVRIWLDDVTDQMMQVFAKSNLYTALPKLYRQIGCFGTSAMAMNEHARKVVHFNTFPIGSYYLANSAGEGIDTFYREFRWRLSQVVEEFGLERCSETIRSQYAAGNLDQWIDIIHEVTPRLTYVLDKVDNLNAPWASRYYEVSRTAQSGYNREHMLRESGYRDFPLVAPRWDAFDDEPYGSNAPGWTALGACKALQLKETRGQELLDKGARPPMVGSSQLQNSPVSMIPGGITYEDPAQPNAGLRSAYDPNPNWYRFLGEDIGRTEERINRSFYVDLFLMLTMSDRRQITAREIVERHEEKLLMLGPVLERLNDELLDPMIDRTFNIMLRNGLLPPAPPELEGQDLRVEYVSIMAQAQKMIGLSSMERFTGFAGSMAQSFPLSLDKVNADEIMDEYAKTSGVPARVIRTDEQVEQIRAQRAQAAQAQQAAQLANQGAQAAKTMSETDVDDPSALRRMVTGL